MVGSTDGEDESGSRTTSPLANTTTISKQPLQESQIEAGHIEDDAIRDIDTDNDDRTRAPLQKRRRVTRACDECRRKKIKCDGKQPCTHCTVYSYDCTYDQPSNRRRNPAPQYIESLEQRLQKAEAILRAVVPGINIDDAKYEARDVDEILEANKTAITGAEQQSQRPQDNAQMRSMVDRTGSLDLDDSGYYDYHGNSSGYSFMRKFRAQFGDDFLPHPKIEHKGLMNLQGSPRSIYSSSVEAGLTPSNGLPPKEITIELCRSAIEDCCALQRPVHRPTFFRRLSSLYATDPGNYNDEQVKFLPQLYSAMAVGCLFGRDDDDRNELDSKGYKHATEQGYQYFHVAKSMLDITDCRDIFSIQAVMFMILFLQGTAKLATCYSYIGVALRACCRLGMHRRITGKFNVIEQEERKRLFWQVRKMDTYVGAMLGLPQMLENDDIDQELPSEAFDEHIHKDGILPLPEEAFPLMRATNAHTRLLSILKKVVRYIYPVRPPGDGQGSGEYMVSHSLIRELERDLQNWMDELPTQLRPSENADIELSRVQQLLRMSYGYVQMMIYRPFLHYVAQSCQNARTDKRSFACAAACVSVARNIVHITSEMKRRGLLMGAYWFVMYTTYFAILSLLYFVLENPESTTSKDILKDAIEGRDTLANLATRSMAADRCTTSLAGLFEALPEKLNERRSSLRGGTIANTAMKRPPPTNDLPFFGGQPAFTVFNNPAPTSTPDLHASTPARIQTMPQEYPKTATATAKRMTIPEQAQGVSASYPINPEATYTSVATPTETLGYGSTQSKTPAPLDFDARAFVQGHLPDLKSVMFPGNNAWDYPSNQPMSTLATMPNVPFSHDSPMSSDNYASGDGQAHHRHSQHFPSQPQFTHPYRAPEQQMQSQAQYFGMENVSDESARVQHEAGPRQSSLQVPGQGEGQDYWSHAPARGQFRTGLTPGNAGVNLDLDDVFGNGQGWCMPMNLNMPVASQQQHGQSQSQHQGMAWHGQSGQNWG